MQGSYTIVLYIMSAAKMKRNSEKVQQISFFYEENALRMDLVYQAFNRGPCLGFNISTAAAASIMVDALITINTLDLFLARTVLKIRISVFDGRISKLPILGALSHTRRYEVLN